MTLVLSLELVKTYQCFFPLVDALRSFRVSRGGTYVPPGRAKVAQTPGRARVKKGCKQIPANYRPVSLTAVPCKVLESIIRDRIMSHMVSILQL